MKWFFTLSDGNKVIIIAAIITFIGAIVGSIINSYQKNNSGNQIKENKIEINQENSNNPTSIGIQNNNYNGLSPEESAKMALGLFNENFPKLQLVAEKIAYERVTELWNEIALKLTTLGLSCSDALLDVDVQYSLLEAQKQYARFGTQELLDKLSSLVANRVKYHNDDMCLKVTIDQAISVIGKVSEPQLDYLSLLFITTKVKFDDISSLEQLKNRFDYLEKVFPKSRYSNWQHLNMLGCFQLELPDVCDINAKRYGFMKSDVERIFSENIKNLSGDFSTSPIGTILAIMHAEQRIHYRFDPKIWIHG